MLPIQQMLSDASKVERFGPDNELVRDLCCHVKALAAEVEALEKRNGGGGEGMRRLSLRIGDLELRSCNHSLSLSEPHETLEIVQWSATFESREKSCFSVAFWLCKGNQFDLKFVGNRPFDADKATFWELAHYGQRYLEHENT